MGDFAEGEYVSHWRWSRRKRPPLEYQLPLIDKEVAEVNMHMDRIDYVLDKVGCKKKYLAMGNHDNWYNAFVEENPYLEQYKPETLFKIKSNLIGEKADIKCPYAYGRSLINFPPRQTKYR